jgi:rfaE bifunctional protein nucleotidyltransferase chain/domain
LVRSTGVTDRSGLSSKIVALDDLLAALAVHRGKGARVAFTNGTFDLLHVGHLRSLVWARQTADLLVVGLNSDASVRLNKAPGRPILPEGERAELLAALETVDYVVLFDEPTATQLVAAIRPDVYVKGGDYSIETLPEAETVIAHGGRVELVPLQEGRSTSGLIREIAARFGPQT